MIVDLTSPKLEATLVNEERDSWSNFQGFMDDEFGDAERGEAYEEWMEFRDARASRPWTRKDAINIMKAALLDEHMRTVLKRCSCRQIRSKVVEIINSLRSIGARAEPATLAAAAACIVDLDNQERQRLDADIK